MDTGLMRDLVLSVFLDVRLRGLPSVDIQINFIKDIVRGHTLRVQGKKDIQGCYHVTCMEGIKTRKNNLYNQSIHIVLHNPISS